MAQRQVGYSAERYGWHAEYFRFYLTFENQASLSMDFAYSLDDLSQCFVPGKGKEKRSAHFANIVWGKGMLNTIVQLPPAPMSLRAFFSHPYVIASALREAIPK
jgi:hypothetical protein